MSVYLQRLLDRAAALPPPGASANPLLISGSPIAAFDQRLASADLAHDFSILGATPDLPESADEAPAPTWPLARRNASGAAPTPPPPAAEPRADHPSPAPSIRAAGRRTPDSAPPEFSEAAKTDDIAPVPSLGAPAGEAAEPPRQPRRARTGPNLPPALPVSVEPEPDRPSPARRAAPDPSPAPVEAVPAAAISESGSPDRAPRPATPPVLAEQAVPEARPLPSATPPVREAARHIPEPPPARPAPSAEPVVAAIPPLAPPLRGLSAEEVERMIDEAIGAERNRSAARAPATVRPKQSQASAPQGEAPPKRPATAAQASLIGSLESSRFRPTLFGVRRR